MYIAIYKTGIISSLTTCTVYISFDSFKSVTILESHAEYQKQYSMSILQNIKFYELEQNFWLLMIDSLIHKFT